MDKIYKKQYKIFNIPYTHCLLPYSMYSMYKPLICFFETE